MGGNRLETATLNQAHKASLGESLVAAREQRGLSRETVVQQTHIPAHYLQMLEDDDYRLISDQLYLLPFLRKYATFLDIDQEETAMRLLREVQRMDNGPSPVRPDEPSVDIRHYRRRDWSKPVMFSGLIAVIIGAYVAQSRDNDSDNITVPSVQSPQAAVLTQSSLPSKEALNTLAISRSSGSVPVRREYSSVPQQFTPGTTNVARQGAQSVSQAMTLPTVTRYEARNSPRRRTLGAHQARNH